MVFDASLNVVAVDVHQPDGENYLLVKMDVGLPLPIAAPGTQQPITTPIGQLHFRIDRETAIRWGGKVAELGEKLKPAGGLEVATDLGAVENAAQQLEQFKNGR